MDGRLGTKPVEPLDSRNLFQIHTQRRIEVAGGYPGQHVFTLFTGTDKTWEMLYILLLIDNACLT
jgi:hypothetical protein